MALDRLFLFEGECLSAIKLSRYQELADGSEIRQET